MRAAPPLFDANACVGYSSAAQPDFPTCAELLTYMNHLGIARALTWHVAARDFHPRWGATRLLEEIAATPGAAERIVPSLCIAPTMQYERGAMDWLTKTMATHDIRALRYPLTRDNWALSDIAPVVDAVLPRRPVLFIDIHEPFQKDDIRSFAETYPQVPLIVTQPMWPHMVPLLDLMRRCDNIYIEMSWLHTYGTLDLLTRTFGADRILFGTGFKSHYGASIASLMHADLTDDSSAAIAHGNLERLLEITPTAQSSAPATINRYWEHLSAGESLGVDTIDAHGHLGELGMWVMEEGEMPAQAEHARCWMDRLGITTMLISGEQALFTDPIEGNRKLEEILRPYNGRFLGYLGFNPFYAEALAVALDDFFSRPFFVGFKILCDYWRVPVTDPRFTPAWEYANAHCLPILLHTWDGAYDAPLMLSDIAPAYPDAAFILGHSGGGDRAGAVALAKANPNVYLEWCGSFTVADSWEETLAQVGPRQILFGTDAIPHDPYWELGRLLSQPFPAEVFPAILGGNMRELLARRRTPAPAW